MAFTPPDPGMPSPNVTADFLRAFVGARFAIDHLVLPTGADAWPAVRGSSPGQWTLVAAVSPLAPFTITLDTFRVLQAGVANPDGSFYLAGDVRLADGSILTAGTAGRLQATTKDRLRIAEPVSVGRGGLTVQSEPIDSAPVAEVSASPVMAPPKPGKVARPEPAPVSA